MKFLCCTILFLCLGSCVSQNNNPDKAKTNKQDTIKTIIEFRPAFEERATVTILDIDGKKDLTFLLENKDIIGVKEDTFYYLKKSLNSKESICIDTGIYNLFAIKIPEAKPEIILDGINLLLQRVKGLDTNFIYMHSPDSLRQKEKFSIAINTIHSLSKIVNDSIINGYMNEVQRYFRETMQQSDTAIWRLRQRKYNINFGY